MSHVSVIGMLLYLILALVGGFLTGLFSRYIYQAARLEFGRLIGFICCVVFYVAPIWAVLSLFKQDDLDVFYILLLIGFAYGLYFFDKIDSGANGEPPAFPPD